MCRKHFTERCVGASPTPSATIMKTCRKCNETLNTTEFYKRPEGGFRRECKKCHCQYQKDMRKNDGERVRKVNRDWKQKNREKISAARRKNTSNFGSEWVRQIRRDFGEGADKHYLEQFNNQNRVCAICENPYGGKSRYGNFKKHSLDHCHKTGKLRGVLCSPCNSSVAVIGGETMWIGPPILYNDGMAYIKRWTES